MTERRWLHDDPYPERTPYGPRPPLYTWQPSWWQRLLARLVGVRF